MTTKSEKAVLSAAMRWYSYHCDQLKSGSCDECTKLYKVIARLSAAQKKRRKK